MQIVSETLFPKNDRLDVHAQLAQDGTGKRFANLRCFAFAADGTKRPTREGVSVGVDRLPALRDAVNALCEAAGFGAASAVGGR